MAIPATETQLEARQVRPEADKSQADVTRCNTCNEKNVTVYERFLELLTLYQSDAGFRDILAVLSKRNAPRRELFPFSFLF